MLHTTPTFVKTFYTMIMQREPVKEQELEWLKVACTAPDIYN